MGIIADIFGGRRSHVGNESKPGRQVSAKFGKAKEVEYAEPSDYGKPPVLTLRPWNYGQGVDDTTAGYGFETPDGKIWPAGQCKWSTWEQLGVLVINAVGEKYHLDDLADSSFDPGKPLRLVPEPDNPHGGNAISIRNLTQDRTAGYVKSGSAVRLRNLLRGHEIGVMALSCRYEPGPPSSRNQLKVVIFRPGRLVGTDHIEPHPKVFG